MKLLHLMIFVIAIVAAPTAFAESHRTIIDAQQAKDLHDRGVLFADVRSKLAFDQSHIPGAKSFDVRKADFIERFSSEVGLEDEVVIYCRGVTCDRSAEAILLLHPLGYHRLYYLKVGLPGWIEAGYPVEQ
ncbi:rhodanese-like domain-containing protein [Cognatishimia maritima]|uniref:Rhodanese-related sulfurtransferase n=1 Tax=Cognatishimia maritima TaxID=870908 RepID=A0A1M5PHN1_9RHOB|nr:rhodanese-like domain-containing protein [Cognatishimia maritima]SHH01272.1 Rhodanese-related sulfurtransferase [Cognatishimia maritima]